MPVRARVTVYPRPEILDPQGKAIAGALGRLGFKNVTEVRAGKSFEIVLKGSRKSAQKQLAEMCKKLLANTVTEDYTVVLLDGEAS